MPSGNPSWQGYSLAAWEPLQGGGGLRPKKPGSLKVVTTRLRAGLPSLRRPDAFAVLERAFAGSIAGAEQHGFRLVHFSVQATHLHFVVEAIDTVCPFPGLFGLTDDSFKIGSPDALPDLKDPVPIVSEQTMRSKYDNMIINGHNPAAAG